MLAERFILRTDREGHLTGLPAFAANEEIEVIVLRKQQQPAPMLSPQALEDAYREASAEIDEAWEATVGDGLENEAW